MLKGIFVLSKNIRSWLTKIFLDEFCILVVEGRSEEGSFQAHFRDGEYDFKRVGAVSHSVLKDWVFDSRKRSGVSILQTTHTRGLPDGLSVYIASKPKIESIGWYNEQFCTVSVHIKKISRFKIFGRDVSPRLAF